jgi:uncharacterized membrane protein YphA (DoxX/SURF4 family)
MKPLNRRKQNLMEGIKDKVVVITGASSGIGEATAVMLAERGANVGGLAVATGFLTRFAALAVASSLLVAAYSNFLMGKDNQLALLYAVLFAGFTFYGGGRYSADPLLFGSR